VVGAAVLLHPLPVAAQLDGTAVIRGEMKAGRYPEAERRVRELLTTTERLHGVDSPEVADLLDILSEVLRKGGKLHEPEALGVCLRAVAIKDSVSAPDSSLAVSLENLGGLHVQNGRLEEGRPPLERALELRIRSLGRWHRDVAWTLIWLGNLEFSAANDDSASALVERAVAIQDSLLPDEDLQHTYGLEMLANIQYVRGAYREATSLYERVLRLRLETLGLDDLSTASVLHNLGSLFVEMGDYDEGRRYLERARAVMRRLVPDGRNPMVARTVNSLGGIREDRGDAAGALSLYQEAVRLQRVVLGPDNNEVATYMMLTGRLNFALGRRDLARRTLLEAMRIQEAARGPKNPDLASTLRALARVDAADGAVDLALERDGRALEIQEGTLGSQHPYLAPTLADLGYYHAMKGDTLGALALALRASQIRANHLRLIAGGVSERQALAYAARRDAGNRTGLDVLLPLVERGGSGGSEASVRAAWDAVAQVRTLVLDEMASRSRASWGDSVDESTTSALRALHAARQRLADILVKGPGDDGIERYQARLRSARLEVEVAERNLGLLNASLASESASRLSLADALGAVPPGWGLAAYATYTDDSKRRFYVAFVNGASGVPAAIPIGDASRIDALVQRWASAVMAAASGDAAVAAKAEAASRTAGRALRRAIWDPVLGALGDVEGVLIVPDGSLQRVNFGALPDSGKSYLVERDLAMHYATSESDIAATHARVSHGSGLLALGGVDFDGASANGSSASRSAPASRGGEGDCQGFYDATFRALPESGREVEEIAGAWGDTVNVTVMTGAQATEDAFKRLAPGKRVIHLATHGFFLDPTRCLQELASSRGIGGLEPAVRPRPRPAFDQASPLLLSGLALASANRRAEATPHEEDGILTAEEVASLDLRGVEWAVLSACDTGIATATQGEGLLGLRRAFHTAGVSALVISLWPVQDEAAREWMTALYKNRASGVTATAQAVRAATLEVLRSRRAHGRSTSPFFWGAFVATGDWD